jgi:amino acid permease
MFVSGYGNIAPRTTLGRVVTLAYAVLGIPLTLIYLSSTGGVLAKVARGVFSRYANHAFIPSFLSI